LEQRLQATSLGAGADDDSRASGPALAQRAEQAQVRVAPLAADAPNVDVYVNGNLQSLEDVPK
jgi:hypothetical protein